MTEQKLHPFRARLLDGENDSLIMEPLEGALSVGDSFVVCSSGEVRSAMSVAENNGRLTVGIDSPLSHPLDFLAGEMIASVSSRPEFVDQFEAEILWQSEQKMLPGRRYSLNCAGQKTDATITKLKYQLDKTSGSQIAANSISKHQTFVGNLALARNIAFDPYTSGLMTSRFELAGPHGQLLATGQIRHSLRRASNVHWQAVSVDKTARAALKHQTPQIIWLTGLSASGKSTIANLVEQKLLGLGKHAYLLDGDNVRHGLNKDLGFTDADRVENIRRIAETSKLMLDAGLIVIASFISPFQAERQMARSLFAEGEFVEVHVDASLAVCEERDPKGLYKKARAGVIKNFTGFDSPYEAPENPEIRIDTEQLSAEEAAVEIVGYLLAKG